ncbi:MAG: succinyl-diaminopimelate desuccinylase [Candidatus Methanomethylicota archaeon]|uniref:Probable succinyl-diaminopimelate desuccinylase n=1 Tax=Thermoproteota archaeon TaxID=2056631 RepID=A0A497EZ00_9CREN|nr:MAG: succinyl-diaminopimelate desuccinylase [Candidatus Verstraetearchaeota archaeon]
MESEAVKILSDLIGFPTVVPPGEHYEDCSKYLAELLSGWGLKVDVLRVPKSYVENFYPDWADYPRFIVLARLEGSSDKPTLHFNGHYDVVPPGSGWSITEPFKAKVVDGKIYGRGSTDMKGGITSILIAARALAKCDANINGVIELSFTPDEEVGGATGVGYIVNEGIVAPDYCVIAEPSSTRSIWFGHKGMLWVKVVVEGKAAHGSTPWLGVNAFEKMVEVAHAMFNELKPRVEAKKSTYDYIDPRGAKATMNIGGEISGGAKINVVPPICSFTIDRRIIPEETPEEALSEIQSFLEELRARDPQLKVKVEVLGKSNACVTDPNSKIVKTAVEAGSEILGISPKPTMCIGGLDMRYFVDKGVETITYGPGVLGVAHMANEYISIKELVTMSKIYVNLAGKLLS